MKYIKTEPEWIKIRNQIFDENYPRNLKQDVKTIDIYEIESKYGKENTDNFLTYLLYGKRDFFYSKPLGKETEMKNGIVHVIYSPPEDIFYASIITKERLKSFPIHSKIYTKEELDYEDAEMKLQANKYNLLNILRHTKVYLIFSKKRSLLVS